jgi:tripartite-type tricarboxylate transporter receptor subunit TctC
MLMGVYMRSIRPGKVGEASAFGVIVLLLKRIVVLPDVPTIGEFVPGYEASGWQGIGAPASTPPQTIAILNKLVNEALASAEFMARFVDLGLDPYATSPAEFGKFIVDYTEKWGKVIRDANIKPQ